MKTIQYKGATVLCYRDASKSSGWDFWSKGAALLAVTDADLAAMARLAEVA